MEQVVFILVGAWNASPEVVIEANKRVAFRRLLDRHMEWIMCRQMRSVQPGIMFDTNIVDWACAVLSCHVLYCSMLVVIDSSFVTTFLTCTHLHLSILH